MNNKMKIKFSPFKLFEFERNQYIFRIYDNKLFQIDEKTRKFLNQEGNTIEQAFENMNQLFTMEECIYLIQNMISLNFLITSEEAVFYVNSQKEKEGLSSVTLMVIQECNMKCSYCYGEGGEYFNKGRMSIDTAIQSIDFLIENSTEDELLVAFFGGEPLMNFSLIQSVVDYCNEREKEVQKTFRFTITTNGTLINTKIEDYLIENNIMIQLSLDGNRKNHDQNRYFANRKGSYDLILERTRNLRKRTRVSSRATLTPENLNYKEVFKHLNSLGFSAIPMAVAENTLKNGMNEMKIEKFIELIEYCSELILSRKYDVVRKLPMIYGILKKLEYPKHRKIGCNVGEGVFAVDIDGSLYPCHRFVTKKDFKVGDVKHGPNKIHKFIEKQNELNAADRKCAKCWANNICLGGCPFENYESTGFMGETSSEYCKFTKITIEKILKLYVGLTDEEKNELFQK